VKVWGSVKKGAGRLYRFCGFEQASPRTCPPLYAHIDCALTHPIRHFRPMVQLQRFERPIRIGNHSNPLRGHQDSHIRGSVPGFTSAFGSIEDLHRVVYEPAHKSLIGASRRTLKLFGRIYGPIASERHVAIRSYDGGRQRLIGRATVVMIVRKLSPKQPAELPTNLRIAHRGEKLHLV
jgi:hypothetical protein